MAPPFARLRAAVDLLVIAAFVAGIALPLADMALGLDSAPAPTEKRSLAVPPRLRWDQFSLRALPLAAEAWWNDHFGFRKRLVLWHSAALYALGVSATKGVILGTDGWLYLAGEDFVAYYRATRPFTESDLARWQHWQEAQRDWLAAQGIPYLLVIAPNKDTMYPEHMPATLNRVRPGSRVDQLLEYLRAHSTLEVLDLRGSLRSAKAQRPAYSRTDTHWNDWGAFVVYREVLDRLRVWFPALQSLPLSAFEPVARDGWSGDLAVMLNVQGFARERRIELLARVPRAAHPASAGNSELERAGKVSATERAGTGLPRAVMFHDSFGDSLKALLSEHFARIVYVLEPGNWFHSPMTDLVSREHPDVVIREFVERSLMAPPPDDPGPEARPISRARPVP